MPHPRHALVTLLCDLAQELDDELRILALGLIVSDGLASPLRSCCLVELPPVELQFCRAGIGAWAALMHAVALPHLWSSACPRPLLMAPMPAWAWLLQALALEAALLLQKPWRSTAFTSASTLSGSAHNSFALIPIRTMASEMASSAGTRQLLCRTQPQRPADGFNRWRGIETVADCRDCERARALGPVSKFATSSAHESETVLKGKLHHLPFNPYMYWCTQLHEKKLRNTCKKTLKTIGTCGRPAR